MMPIDKTVLQDSNQEEWLCFNNILKLIGKVELEDISLAIIKPPYKLADLLTLTSRVEVEDILLAIAKLAQEVVEEIVPRLVQVGSVVKEEVYKTEV